MVRPGITELSKAKRFGLLAVLYFSQGVPFGLFMQALPVMLRERGVSLEAIGFSAVLALPWALKFAWAPWVDRRPPGAASLPRRKGWLVPIQLVTIALFFALGALELYDDIIWLLAAIFVVNFLNATQDIATDGLAVDILDFEERGAGNSLQVGGYRLGMIAGGAGVLVLIEALGWSIGLLSCAAILLVALVPLLLVREDLDEAPDSESASTTSYFARLRGFFDRPWALHVLAIAAAFKFGDAMAGGMLRPMLVDQNFSMGQIGWILGGVGFAFGLIGAGAGGVVGDRLTRHHALLVAFVVQLGGVLLYIPLAVESLGVWQVSVLIAIEHFVGGVATVVLFACMMDWTRPGHSGTDYTLLASVVVIATGLATSMSGVSAKHLGYTGHFALCAALALIGGAAALWLYARARKLDPTLTGS